MSDKKKSDLIEIGGLWLNESANGKYMSGYLGRAKLLIFANKFKEADNQPDYRMYVAPKPDEGEKGGGNQGGDQGGAAPADDSIPF